MEGELPKLPPFRVQFNDPKINESKVGVGFAFGNRSNPDVAPFEMLHVLVEPIVFGLGFYLDVLVGNKCYVILFCLCRYKLIFIKVFFKLQQSFVHILIEKVCPTKMMILQGFL